MSVAPPISLGYVREMIFRFQALRSQLLAGFSIGIPWKGFLPWPAMAGQILNVLGRIIRPRTPPTYLWERETVEGTLKC